MAIKKILAGWGVEIVSNNLYENIYTPTFNSNSTDNATTAQWHARNDGYTVTVNLSSEIVELLAWARVKMDEEKQLQLLAEQFPILDEAIKDLAVIKALVKHSSSK